MNDATSRTSTLEFEYLETIRPGNSGIGNAPSLLRLITSNQRPSPIPARMSHALGNVKSTLSN